MPPKQAGMTIEPAKARSTTGRQAKTVRVWGEVSLTLAVSQDPPQFIKVTFGHERMCADNDEAITRMERVIHRKNEEVVDRRAKSLTRLIRQINVS